jgi:cytochrome c oxidase assembly protein subunit 15
MPDRLLAQLATLTAITTWLLVVVGGVVRVTGSGMGCPDWPTCFGGMTPPAHLDAGQHLPAWIEMGHRYLAGLVGLMVAGTAALAWRRRAAGAPWRLALLSGVVVVAQIGLGAVTVWQQNAPWTVSAHLLAALALLATTTGTALLAAGPQRPVQLTPAAWLLVASTLLLALVGSVVQTTGGGWACPDLPGCGGQLWPASLGLPAQAHMLHRFLVLVTAVALAAVAWPAWRAGGSTRRWAAAAAALFGLQALVGVAQVMLLMPDALRGLHLALAAAFWTAVVGLVLRAGQAHFAALPTTTSQKTGLGPALESR